MKHLRTALLLMCAYPGLALATDCDVLQTNRNVPGSPWSVTRVILADGKTSITTSTKCETVAFQAGKLPPWDFYRFIAEEGDTCTSWTATVRDYPVNATAQCRGTCDAQDLQTLDKSATTSKAFNEPLGEALDVDVTAITCTGGVSVFVDFYHRDQGK